MDKEKNARIEKTFLGIEDHRFFTFFLHLDYGDSGHQGAGGYVLVGKSFGIIRKILEMVGINEWEELSGKHIKVKATHGGVCAIQNILGGEWLDFDEYFEGVKNA